MKKKKKVQFLNKPYRFMVRFDKAGRKLFEEKAARTGLPLVEYARRKILDIPIADITSAAAQTQEGATV